MMTITNQSTTGSQYQPCSGSLKRGSYEWKSTEKSEYPEKEDLQAELEHLQKMAASQVNREKHKAIYQAMVSAVRDTPDSQASALLCVDLLRAALIYKVGEEGHVDESDMAMALGYTFENGQDETDALIMHIRRCSSADIYRATAITLTIEDQFSWQSDAEAPMLNAMVSHLNLNTKAASKAAIAAVKSEYAEKIKEVQAEINAKSPVLHTTPLAQPQLARGKSPKSSGSNGRPASSKAKMSEEEAKSGIAAAMQEVERAATAPPGDQQSDQAGSASTDDDLFVRAVELITKEQVVSKRLLKSGLKIGDDRALDLLAKLETAGKVSACSERGARKVLVTV